MPTAPALGQRSAVVGPLPEAHLPDPPPLWFTFDDYPREAVIARMEGVVDYRLTLGIDGRVRDCAVLRSSGYALLDDQTCAILRRRAKLTPPLDDAGRSVASLYVGTKRWQLPPGVVKPPEPFRTLKVVMRDGRPLCTVDWNGTQRDLRAGACRRLTAKLPKDMAFPITLRVSATAQELGFQ